MFQEVSELKIYFKTTVGNRGPSGNCPLTGKVFVNTTDFKQVRIIFGMDIHSIDLCEIDELAKLCRKAAKAYRAAKKLAEAE